MYKTLILAVALLIPAAWLQAQDTMSKSSGKPSPTTIEGCLQTYGSYYRLTDSSGKVYQLTGNAQKLKDHVGHQIQITGTPGVKTIDTTQPGVESTAKEVPVFQVKSVQHVADTCSAK
jgi:hypothetical protein